MLKKIIACLLVLSLAIGSATTTFAYDDDGLPEAIPVMSGSDSLPAASAVLIEQGTGRVLFSQNPDEALPPASITKVMTMLLVMEAIDSGKISLDDLVVTSEHAASMGGSQIWLMVGEEMTVDQLLKAVAISSANDASVALAEHVAGSEQAFVDMMNQRAAILGMTNTKFYNTTGLDEEGHLSSAMDIAIMSRELMRYPLISQYSTIWMDSLRGGATELVNTNRLVRFYEGATGLKTGTTHGAGSCLSATANRDGLYLIAVVMGSPTSEERFAAARGLLDYGFANYMSVAPPPVDDQLAPVRVLRGESGFVTPIYHNVGIFVVEKQHSDSLTQVVTMADDLEAPVEAGQIIGQVDVMVGGEVIGSYHLRAAYEVPRMTMPRAFAALGQSLLRLSSSAPKASTQDQQPLPEPEPPPCTCTEGECYCEEIGDVCGCQG